MSSCSGSLRLFNASSCLGILVLKDCQVSGQGQGGRAPLRLAGKVADFQGS